MEKIQVRRGEDTVIGIREAAERLGISVNTLYSWVNQRKIEYVKMGRLVKFRQGALDQFIQEHTVPFKE